VTCHIVGDTPVSRRSHGMKPSMKAMPGTVPPLTSFCLAWVGQQVSRSAHHRAARCNPLPPLSSFQNSAATAGTPPEQVRILCATSALPNARKPCRIPTPFNESEAWVECAKPDP
jgi:hypothetical protein